MSNPSLSNDHCTPACYKMPFALTGNGRRKWYASAQGIPRYSVTSD